MPTPFSGPAGCITAPTDSVVVDLFPSIAPALPRRLGKRVTVNAGRYDRPGSGGVGSTLTGMGSRNGWMWVSQPNSIALLPVDGLHHARQPSCIIRARLALLRHFHSSLCRTMTSRHLGHRRRTRAARCASSARRTAGKVGWGGGLVVQVFPPLATLLKPEVLQEVEGDQHHQGVVVQAGPGSPLEVVETELFLHLLM